MSLVDSNTGEVVVLDEATARELVESIRTTGEMMWRQVVRAFQGRAWIALGYSSWDELCEHEFAGARIKLPREERREVVASLSDAGMSTRAIGAAIGVSHMTTDRDLESRVTNVTPADPDDDIVDAEIIDHKPITGLDGKQYPKPKPAPQVGSDEWHAIERERALDRAARRLERFCETVHEFRGLADNPDRDEILARLQPSDVEIVLETERSIQWLATAS